MTKKHILLVILFATTFLLNAQDKQLNQDSLSFVKTNAEFVKYEQVHGHYIQTNNVKMHYLAWGKSTGKPLVWVHGTYSNSYEFFGFADSLVKQGYYVIAIDYYGHGFTPVPDKEVSLYSVADDIKFLLDRLKIKNAVIGGWSRGGCVATAFYDAYPNYVSGLILEDGGSVAAATTDSKLPIDSFTTKFMKILKSLQNC
jgi:pimeloyl-ACP methyl ester carboxylesterase